MSWLITLLWGVLVLSAIALGGLVALKFKRFLPVLIAFCSGTLIAAALTEILPEALALASDEKQSTILLCVLVSFLFFHLIDKVLFVHGHTHEHDDEHEENRHSLGALYALGIVLHTLLDGIVIGTSFLVNSTTGLLVAAIILLHDFTDGISTVTVLLRHQQTRRTMYFTIGVAAVATMAGVVAAQLFPLTPVMMSYLLATFAGFFLYLGAGDLLPEAHKERVSRRLVFVTMAGALVVVLAGLL